jgi:hypothetical protein
MKYKCIGNPKCLKSFEFGPALRAHIASCEIAQRVLRNKEEINKLEHQISYDYPGIYGLHMNPYYPTHHHLDKTLRFNFVDRFKDYQKSDNVASSLSEQPSKFGPRRLRKAASNSNMHGSSQVKSLLVHP